MFDIRRAIEGISLEIKRMGLEINPAKFRIMIKDLDLEKEELVYQSRLKTRGQESIDAFQVAGMWIFCCRGQGHDRQC